VNFGFSGSYVALWGFVVLQGLLVLAVLRQLTELRRRMEQGALQDENWLPLGSPAPEFTGRDMSALNLISNQFLNGQGRVIVFLSPGCTSCKGLAESLESVSGYDSSAITAICNGDTESCEDFRTRLGASVHLLYDPTNEIGLRYGVSKFPTTVVVDKELKIRAYGHPQSAKDIKQLFERALGEISIDEDISRTRVQNQAKLAS
jgi:methylamine dehydrogenase accessory protein MauD